MTSASAYRRSEDIGVLPIVIEALKLRNIQRHVLFADLVERTHDTTLDNRPEALNRVRVYRADNVLVRGMADSLVIIIGQVPVSGMFIGAKQADFIGHGFPNEAFHRRGIGVLDNPRHDVALAADRTNDSSFAR